MATLIQGVEVPVDFHGPIRQDPRAPYYHLVPKDKLGNLEWRRRMVQFGAQNAQNARALYQMCAADILFYLNTFVLTYDPRLKESPTIPFNTYPFQDRFILDMVDKIGVDDLLVEKSRDMGASWVCLMVFEWFFHFRQDLTFLLVSRKEDLVDKSDDPDSLMWKLDFVHENQPTWIRPNGAEGIRRSKLKLYNPRTRSTIGGCSTTGDIARGGRRTAILLDEFASVVDGYAVLKATRDATDCRIFNSTPKGVGNAFYDLREKGDIVIFRFHWYLHPVKAKDAYWKLKVGQQNEFGAEAVYGGEERRALGNRRPNTSPWYEKQCKRAVSLVEIAQELDIDYRGSDYQFFNADEITRRINEFCKPASFTGEPVIDPQTHEVVRLDAKPFGSLRLWCHVDINGMPVVGQFDEFVIGADVSTGQGASNSVLSIGHKATGEKIGEYAKSKDIPEHKFAVVAVAMAKLFATPHTRTGALLIWEANGPGLTFGGVVINDLEYYHIYYRKAEARLNQKRSDQPGWFSTLDTKQRLLGQYRAAVGSQFINRSREAMMECLEYIYEGHSIVHSKSVNTVDPTGAKANHGDRVIADALCWKGIKENRSPSTGPLPLPKPPESSFGGRRADWETAQRDKREY